MIKVGVADYGMYVWEGGLFDYEERLLKLKRIGFDGLERLRPVSESDAIHKAGMVRRLGMDFGTCLAPDIEHSIEWTSALGKDYVWTVTTAKDLPTLCRQANIQAEICRKWGIRTALHNHLGSLVETQKELITFLESCPDCALVLDTGHLAVAEGGDPLYIVEHYFDRIAAVHVKDWVYTDRNAAVWHDQGYFCELGGGNHPVPNDRVVSMLVERGYNGWVFIEHDTHKYEPVDDLAKSRAFLRNLGI